MRINLTETLLCTVAQPIKFFGGPRPWRTWPQSYSAVVLRAGLYSIRDNLTRNRIMFDIDLLIYLST